MEFESGGGDGGGGLSSAAVVGIRGDEAEGEDVEKPPWRERSSGGVESEVSRGECGSGHEGQIQASADSDGGEEREARPGGEVELGSEVSRGECGSGHEGQIQASADPEDSVEATRLRDEMVGQSPKSLGVEEPEGSKKRKRSAERGVMGEGAQKRRCVMMPGCRHTESVAEPESSDAQRRGRSRGRPRKRGRRSLESSVLTRAYEHTGCQEGKLKAHTDLRGFAKSKKAASSFRKKRAERARRAEKEPGRVENRQSRSAAGENGSVRGAATVDTARVSETGELRPERAEKAVSGSHRLAPAEDGVPEAHALVSRRVRRRIFEKFQREESKRRRPVTDAVKLYEKLVASYEEVVRKTGKARMQALKALLRFEKQHKDVAGVRARPLVPIPRAARKKMRPKRVAAYNERRKLSLRWWELEKRREKTQSQHVKAVYKLRGALTSLKIASHSKEMQKLKTRLHVRSYTSKHLEKERQRWRSARRQRLARLNKQKKALLSSELCAKVLEGRKVWMSRTRRYLRRRRAYVDELASLRSFRRLQALGGSGGLVQPGTRAEREKREAEFKAEVVERLFRSSRQCVSLKNPGEPESPRKSQRKVDAELKKAIALSVDAMIGMKRRIQIQFMGHYRRLRREAARWAKEKEQLVSGTWEDVIRPPETACHRPHQREFGEVERASAACDASCRLPPNWGERLVRQMGKLRAPTTGLHEAFEGLMEFESCTGCVPYLSERVERDPSKPGFSDGERALCLLGEEGCEDGMKLLLRLRCHSRVLDRLTDTVYKARKVMKEIIALETAVVNGSYGSLCETLKLAKERHVKDMNGGVEVGGGGRREMRSKGPDMSREGITAQYGRLMDAFHEVERDHPLQVCFWCEQYFRASAKSARYFESMESVPQRRGNNTRENLERCLERRLGSEVSSLSSSEVAGLFPMRVCGSCWKWVSKGQVGGGMLENGLGLDEVPEELASLNRYEELLISRVRPFYSVVKLKPYGLKGRDHMAATGLKGNAAHLRIPIEKTMNHCLETMPPREPEKHFRIYADVKTSAGKVWRNLVDMEKVLKALEWLKKNNPLWSDIKIDREAANKVDPSAFVVLTCSGTEGTDSAGEAAESEAGGGETGSGTRKETGTHILTQARNHEMVSEYSMQPANDPVVQPGEDLEVYMQTKVTGEPLSRQAERMDALCFPRLFPRGSGSLSEVRPRRLRVAEHSKYLMRRAVDKRFWRNQTFMHSCHYLKLDRAIQAGKYASTKTGSGLLALSAGDLRRRIESKSEEVENSLSSLFQKIKGTKEYWDVQKGDLRVMDEELGPATWFVTLSCAEYRWEEFDRYIRQRNADLEKVASMPLWELAQKDPAALSEFFMRRFKGFMDEVILKPDGPLGTIEHYYWRLEYQARGAPHIHMKLWQKDAPILGAEGVTDEAVLEHIAKYVTASVPRDEENMDLRVLVDSFQRHKCTPSCRKLKFGKSGKCWQQCRYGYPRPINDAYVLNGLVESVKSKHRRGRLKKLYEVPRSADEVNINCYNPAILQAWRANMDIQFVGESSRVLNSYITGYMTKGEKGETADIFEAMGKDKSVHARLMSLAYGALKSREVGPYEIADDLLGHHLHGASTAVEWVGVGMPGKRSRKLLPFEILKQLPPDSTSIVAPNIVENYYPNRHEAMEAMSLHEVASQWRYKKVGPRPQMEDEEEDAVEGEEGECEERNEGKQERYMTKDEKGFFVKRRKPVLVKTRYIPCTPARSEEYLQILLQLHVPYRCEDEILAGKETYAEAFKHWVETLPALETAVKAKEKMREAAALIQRLEAEALAEEEEGEDGGAGDVPWADAQPTGQDPQGFRSVPDYLTDAGLENRKGKLNAKQREIYDEIVNGIGHQLRHKSGTGTACECGSKPEPIRKFVSGGAGVGKSRLIQTLTEAVEKLSGESVLISAPTGLAAKNIDGETSHSLFNLPIQREGVWTKRELTKEALKTLWHRLGSCSLLIIDEISMVSNVMLEFIHERLVAMKKGDGSEPFASFNIVVLGDLLQLPPVSASKKPPYCFSPLSKADRRSLFPDSMALTDALSKASRLQGKKGLWESFSYAELTENMRQAGDREFADLLNQLRVGQVSEKTAEVLRGRVVQTEDKSSGGIAKLLTQLCKEGKTPVCLLPKVNAVLEVNVAMLVENDIDVTFLHALDATRQRKRKSGKGKGKESGKTGKTYSDLMSYLREHTTKEERDTGGLPDVLPVGPGARVMLTKNLDLAQGLFNGAMGTVTELKRSATNTVSSIMVRFDANPSEEVRIERSSVMYTPSPAIEVQREQFPLRLCYAITVHKSQGLSLDCVVTDLGPDMFCPGMAYVALSRARTLDGLYLLSFDPSSIWADKQAVEEYNRLRRVGKTGLPDLVMGKRAQAPTKVVLKRTFEQALPDLNLATTEPPAKKGRGESSGRGRGGGRGGRAGPRGRGGRCGKGGGEGDRGVEGPNVVGEYRCRLFLHLLNQGQGGQRGVGRGGGQGVRGPNVVGEYRGRLFLPLENPGNQCFGNAAVQGLLALRRVEEWARGEEGGLESEREASLRREFRALMDSREGGNGVAQSTLVIRDVVNAEAAEREHSDDFSDGDQKDSLEFLSYLLECSGSLKRGFTWKRCEVLKCKGCSVERRIGSEDAVELTLERPKKEDESVSFAEMVEKSLGKEATWVRCEQCQPGVESGEGVEQEKWVEVEFPPECVNLLIRVQRMSMARNADGTPMLVARGPGEAPGIVEEELKGKVSGFSAGRVMVGNQMWKTKAAVIHEGATMSSGHYSALTDEQGKGEDVRWLLKSDTLCTNMSRFVPNMKGIYYLLLERAEK